MHKLFSSHEGGFTEKYSKSLKNHLSFFTEHLHLETAKDKIINQTNLGLKKLSLHLPHFMSQFLHKLCPSPTAGVVLGLRTWTFSLAFQEVIYKPPIKFPPQSEEDNFKGKS